MLSIRINMLPPGRTSGYGRWYDYRNRFGAIGNFDEVRAFFEPEMRGGWIGNLAYDKHESSRPNRLIIRIVFMDEGDPVLVIRCRNMTVWQDTPDPSPEISSQSSLCLDYRKVA